MTPSDPWRGLCDELLRVADSLGEEPFPQDGRGRAEGMRHLARQLLIALEGELEHSDPRNPSFHRYEEPWSQWGGPNPDNVYLRAVVDPAATYRVSGNVDGVRAAIFSVCEGDMHLGQYRVFGERTLNSFNVADDGAFECILSTREHSGNWLPLHDEARLFLVRQYQCDWARDRVARLHIDVVDGDISPRVPAVADVGAALRRAGEWVARSVEYWCAYAERARQAIAPNTVVPPTTPRGGAPNIAYGSIWWALAAEDALVIEFDEPDADYWGWTIHNRFWFDSGDFANRQTSMNRSQTYVDADGRVRLVVSARDPGVPNWIDTEDRREGMLVYRYVGARTKPVPTARVAAYDAVRSVFPDGHPSVSAEQRRSAIAARRAAVYGRYL
jgi:hypothetical protein